MLLSMDTCIGSVPLPHFTLIIFHFFLITIYIYTHCAIYKFLFGCYCFFKTRSIRMTDHILILICHLSIWLVLWMKGLIRWLECPCHKHYLTSCPVSNHFVRDRMAASSARPGRFEQPVPWQQPPSANQRWKQSCPRSRVPTLYLDRGKRRGRRMKSWILRYQKKHQIMTVVSQMRTEPSFLGELSL